MEEQSAIKILVQMEEMYYFTLR